MPLERQKREIITAPPEGPFPEKDVCDYLKATKDPRAEGKSPWDDYPFSAGNKYLKGDYLKEVQDRRK